MKGLGRKEPVDWTHVEKYPLSAYPVTSPNPVVLGINWYSNFDNPVKDDKGRYWIGKSSLGSIRGGHAICAKPGVLRDYLSWWDYYDQGQTGECVGYSLSRCMSLVNRHLYRAEWLYMQATLIDPWPDNDNDPEAGTAVDSGFSVLKSKGHWRRMQNVPELSEGIDAYRWCTSVDEIHSVLKSPLANSLDAIPLVNSWGNYYPHIVWLPNSVLDRLLHENGEAGTITDR